MIVLLLLKRCNLCNVAIVNLLDVRVHLVYAIEEVTLIHLEILFAFIVVFIKVDGYFLFKFGQSLIDFFLNVSSKLRFKINGVSIRLIIFFCIFLIGSWLSFINLL